MILVVMILLMTFISFASAPHTLSKESMSREDTMYVTVFFSTHPGELDLVKNVHLLLENLTIGPPVNTSLTSFNNGFVDLEYALTPHGDKFFISFNIFFDASVENETACSYADEIIEEFLRVFGYQELNLLWGNQGIRESDVWGNQESKMCVHRSFGYGPYNKEQILTFLQYQPTDGFARFIDGLLNKYVPGNSRTKLSSAYWLRRIGSDFYWTLKVTGATSEVLPWDVQNYSESINVNELLNASPPLIDQPSENQRIIVQIEKNATYKLSRGITTYTIDIQKIEPEGYTLSDSEYWPNTIEIKYEPLFPIENVIIDITVHSSTQRQEFPFRLVVVIIISLAVASPLLFFYLKKKREEGEKIWVSS